MTPMTVAAVITREFGGTSGRQRRRAPPWPGDKPIGPDQKGSLMERAMWLLQLAGAVLSLLTLLSQGRQRGWI